MRQGQERLQVTMIHVSMCNQNKIRIRDLRWLDRDRQDSPHLLTVNLCDMISQIGVCVDHRIPELKAESALAKRCYGNTHFLLKT